MADLNPLTLGDTPEEYIENEDGSVTLPEMEKASQDSEDFYANLAEVLDQHTLDNLASELCELVDRDKQSRKRRDQQYEDGIRRTGLGDDAPGGATFDGASKVVHPILAEACVDFGSSAIKELFPPQGPVRTNYVGKVGKDQIARGDRKKELMNWQLTNDMPEFVDELEQLVSQMPLGGSQYLKIRRDDDLGRPVAEFVPIDEVFLPYATTNFYTSSRVTHRQMITRQTFEDRVASGFYTDVSVITPNSAPDQSASSIATDKVEGIEETCYNEDGLRAVLEMYIWRKFEDDTISGGARVPYVVHIDEHSQKTLALYRNWDEEDPKMKKLDWMVEFKFIPWRGAYGIGLPHLIGGLSAALTGALRALLDSAHINNAASMLKLKGGRVTGQNTQVDITGVTEVEAPANVDDIRKIAMPMPFNPPSPVLFQLLGFLVGEAKGVVSTAEEKIAEAGNQMPVGTALALIEQGSKVFSAIHGRMHRSMAKVLEILARINSKSLDEEEQLEKLGKVVASREDFIGSMDVLPASDPNIFSETQRFAQLQSLLQMSQADAGNPNIQWNHIEIRHRILNLMHVQQADQLLPPVPEPVTSDPLTESDSVLQGKPIKAEIHQDHLAHIRGHLAFTMSPMVAQNPLAPTQVAQMLLAHVNEHMQMLYAQIVTTIAQALAGQGAAQTLGEEGVIALAIEQASPEVLKTLQPFMATIGQLQQMLQQRTPQPPMPPEVQASLQIGMAEVERKKQYDQVTLQMKQAEMQANQATEQARQQLEAARQQFEQFMAQQQQMLDARSEEMKQQLELIRNEQDNRTHQITELLKNHEDNQTAYLIEQMRQHQQQVQSVLDRLLNPQPTGGEPVGE